MTAMAMSCRPDLIIFDEPTTALDVTTQIEVLAAIRNIVEQFGTAAIYITHDLAVVAQMADRIKVLLKGARSRRPTPAPCWPSPADYTRIALGGAQLQRETQAAPAGPAGALGAGVSAAYGKVTVLQDVSLRHLPRRTWRWWANPARASPPRRG
jgi:peptide/nickel transport system ATP-binding protein